VGCDEGSRDGIWVGMDVGIADGCVEIVGICEGSEDGSRDGRTDG